MMELAKPGGKWAIGVTITLLTGESIHCGIRGRLARFCLDQSISRRGMESIRSASPSVAIIAIAVHTRFWMFAAPLSFIVFFCGSRITLTTLI
ncbi:hypothetical protein VTK73DRAFT_7932 [Phialemonium thermophilum]|uniref:Secreted protein n=1 Tax=Phialemonium thermophilum TaxID=223376 RepID=A0ABR3WBS6_9PEZI